MLENYAKELAMRPILRERLSCEHALACIENALPLAAQPPLAAISEWLAGFHLRPV